MSKINSFTIYKEYYELITLLNYKDQKEMWMSIIEYMFEDKIPILNDNSLKIFNNLKRPLDKSKNKSKNALIQNQNEIKTKSNENQNEIKSNSHQDVNVSSYDNNYVVNVNVKDRSVREETIFDFIEKNFGRTLNSLEYEEILNWEDTELTRYAIKQSVLNCVYNIKYIASILQNYKVKNIKTVVQAQEDEKKFKNRNKHVEPDWFNKEIEPQKISEEEKQEIENMLSEFKK